VEEVKEVQEVKERVNFIDERLVTHMGRDKASTAPYVRVFGQSKRGPCLRQAGLAALGMTTTR
ncbi:MAG: hypothetical protein WAK30_19275, partial [Candidatus Acidiferrales bacterium]